MEQVICSQCGEVDREYFYSNSKKLNGLDSSCKSCVLLRKANKYKKMSELKKKTKALRKDKKCSVLDVGSCMVTTRTLNSIYPEMQKLLTTELVRNLLCHLKK